MRWAGHVARMEEGRSALIILTGKPRRRWEDKIRMDLKEMCVKAGYWVDVPQDKDYWRAIENAALNLWVP